MVKYEDGRARVVLSFFNKDGGLYSNTGLVNAYRSIISSMSDQEQGAFLDAYTFHQNAVKRRHEHDAHYSLIHFTDSDGTVINADQFKWQNMRCHTSEQKGNEGKWECYVAKEKKRRDTRKARVRDFCERYGAECPKEEKPLSLIFEAFEAFKTMGARFSVLMNHRRREQQEQHRLQEQQR
jgi:hypothetical protein